MLEGRQAGRDPVEKDWSRETSGGTSAEEDVSWKEGEAGAYETRKNNDRAKVSLISAEEGRLSGGDWMAPLVLKH